MSQSGAISRHYLNFFQKICLKFDFVFLQNAGFPANQLKSLQPGASFMSHLFLLCDNMACRALEHAILLLFAIAFLLVLCALPLPFRCQKGPHLTARDPQFPTEKA